ncbi:carotenoid oxygenase family protein [Sphingopyxis granuli]|uniref:carotenoid oxygenase family protein n=1 Tax=Sphingopyxis granuli TaxID=267128 RepID=UPI001A3ADCE2|nr:carotenoid oxygenase family protein [Sphingopyxis granuli]MBL8649938.1 carotenoid oxygenase family protein [Sphingopyxis sp.]QUM74610.1 carotenoid oxygenase family protein [Sphingopyxis granuli]
MSTVTIENRLNLQARESDNDYLEHPVYAPTDAEVTATDMPAIGAIPADLDGVYVRNGHNPLFQPRSGRYHWFDGDSMLHAIHFENGRATFRNRMVMTAGLIRELEAGEGLFPGLRDGFEAEEGLKNNSGTDVVLHNGEFKTMFSRCGVPYRINPITLETLGPDTFGGKWHKGISAHSKVDERTGELMFFNYSFNTMPYMEYGVVSADGELLCSTEIELPGPRLPHDCWITENYTILHDMPLFWDPEALARGRKKLVLDRSMKTRFGVIPRHGSNKDIRWFEFEPTYMLHTGNAWEQGDEIVAYGFPQLTPIPDVPAGTASVKTQNYFLTFQTSQPRMAEFRMNLKTGECSERMICTENVEMPGMNYRYLGIRNRYLYNTYTAEVPYFVMEGVQKYDLEALAEVDSYRLPKGKYMGQPVFAPRPDAKAEDDGYLIAFVHDVEGTRSEVYIWDGAAIGDGPVCRIQLPVRVPGGSHAYWGSGADIRAARERRTKVAA